jgi:hypothetical protein
MRRLLAIKLIVLLFAPWIAAFGGTAPGVVPCPMHRSSEGSGSGQALGHQQGAEHSRSPQHGTTAHGCNCASECGRSGTSFTLPAREHLAVASLAVTEGVFASEQPDFASFARFLPFSTGPPQRLLT